MIQKIKKFIVVGVVSLGLTMPGLLAPVIIGGGTASAAQQITNNLCGGANAAAGGAGANSCGSAGSGDASGGLKDLAATIVKYFSIIVGAISVIMIIYGGFRYITSGGDSGRVGNAKNTLIYAVIGLIVVALAQLIVQFVVNSSTSAGSEF